jgi:hemoglobin
MNPETQSTLATPFEWIGGEARVHALVERFYDLMVSGWSPHLDSPS